MIDVQIKQCSPEELNDLVNFLDKEFIPLRGSNISIKTRFPSVFEDENLKNIFIARDGENILSSGCIRPFNWITPNVVYKGAMVGLVATHPQARNQGLATSIMREIQFNLRALNYDFGVLWTDTPAFYHRFGWTESDGGICGEVKVVVQKTLENKASARPISEDDTAWMEILRRRWFPLRVGRQHRDFSSIPFSADNIEIISHDSGNKDERFYVLLGREGQTGSVFEVVGKPSSYPLIWDSICQTYEQISIYENKGSLFENWLNRSVTVNWTPQKPAMWLTLRDKLPIQEWYIPTFDRI
jgi:predicted N-acetyltransferase YhbS